ncbi:MAG: hypothetical protein FGM32_07860 [Candidatus Kapabacteria bacterium]|nr:hypothetical protein [Candidatus Kapabacteria bacterium]
MTTLPRNPEPLRIECVSVRQWCRHLRSSDLNRPWDLLFPPEHLYADRSSFEIGTQRVHACVVQGTTVIAVYVIAMRDRTSCLMDVRCVPEADSRWPEAMLEHWEGVATGLAADAMVGPVGAFAFLTDGVAIDQGGEANSIHNASYPHTIVDSLVRRGYVHAWSGAVWGRHGSIDPPHRERNPPISGVRRGTWMSIGSSVRELERVLSASFASLPWHRGSGAGTLALARAYVPVYSPSLALFGESSEQTVGAVLMYRDVSSVPSRVYSWPRIIQRLWLWAASRRSNEVHVNIIGIIPEHRGTNVAMALFAAAQSVLRSSSGVVTSLVRTENRSSQMMCTRAGLSPLEHRVVFQKVLSTISNY